MLFAIGVSAQEKQDSEQETDSLEKTYMIIDGDSVPREMIDLEEVVLLKKS